MSAPTQGETRGDLRDVTLDPTPADPVQPAAGSSKHEPTAPVRPSRGRWRLPRIPSVEHWYMPDDWRTHLVQTVSAVGAGYVASSTYDPVRHLSGTWAISINLLLSYCVVSSARPVRWTRHRALVMTWVGLGDVAGMVLGGSSLGAALWIVLVNFLVVVGIATMIRPYLSRGDWAIRTTRDVALYAVAGYVTGAGLATFGGVVDGGFWQLTPTQWLSWALRAGNDYAVGSVAAICMWVNPPTHDLRVKVNAQLIVGGLLSEVLYFVPFVFSGYPLSWVLLIPGAWMGLSLTPKVIAVAAYILGVNASISNGLPLARAHYETLLSPGIAVQSLTAAASLLAISIACVRADGALLDTEAERQEQDELAQRELLETVFGGMSEGLVLADEEGRITTANSAARTLLGAAVPDTLDAQDWVDRYELTTPAGYRRPVASLARVMESRHDGSASVEVRVGNGDDDAPKVLEFSGSALSVEGERRRLVLISDVSARHARTRQLESFAGTVAHDLRGPLTGLSGWMETADEYLTDGDEEGGATALERARSAAVRMRTTIDDYLAFTVAREGVLRPTRIVVGALAAEAAEGHGHDGDTPAQITIDAPDLVLADTALVRQLLSNLIGNAVKYSRPGVPAAVTVTSTPDAESGWVRIEVADQGVGIRPGEESAIFGAYRRSDKDAASHQGIGLGLALCHSIVTRHGGRISARRNDAGGATFSFTLPAAR